MFTGIVLAKGVVSNVEQRGGDVRLRVGSGNLDMSDVARGDSVCVSGVCLTAIDPDAKGFHADISNETLSRTTLGALRVGDGVNLEKSLRLFDRLGGHLVSGHVDAVGRVLSIEPDARAQRWRFEIPAELSKYVAAKGSVCIDGVSLTVNDVDANTFGVTLIPHTVAVTTFAEKRVGDSVNIEVDMIARYVERLRIGSTP